MNKNSWESNILFKDLTRQQLSFIEPYVYEATYAKGELVMKEGDPGDFLFMISEGAVIVSKGELILSTIEPGNLVGLMSLVDESPRSATVTAGGEGASGFIIDKLGWEKILISEKASVDSIILTNFLKYQLGATRNTNELGLQETRARLEEEHKRVISAHFFAQMVLGLIIFTFCLGFLSEWAGKTESTYVSFVLLGLYAAWSYYYVRHCGLPRESFGMTMTNFNPALKIGAKLTLGFLVVVIALKWTMITFFEDRFGNTLIEWPYQGNTAQTSILIMVMYSIHAAFQEFIARGCIQGGLMQFITGKGAVWKSVVLATLMFSSFHLMMDLKYAFISIIPGLMWGYMFYRQKNILVVALSHIVIGVVAIFLLNLMG